ncbi:MAG: hypothetical protein KF857_00700 [Fimbriimonadaceae bacterium]|nr:hypothetical protein [Fimbriimonadaceae bacterium]
MDRLSESGWPRHQLAWVLAQNKFVAEARRLDSCLLCRSPKVNEAGLCEGCYASLEPPDIDLAERWLAGAMPR